MESFNAQPAEGEPLSDISEEDLQRIDDIMNTKLAAQVHWAKTYGLAKFDSLLQEFHVFTNSSLSQLKSCFDKTILDDEEGVSFVKNLIDNIRYQLSAKYNENVFQIPLFFKNPKTNQWISHLDNIKKKYNIDLEIPVEYTIEEGILNNSAIVAQSIQDSDKNKILLNDVCIIGDYLLKKEQDFQTATSLYDNAWQHYLVRIYEKRNDWFHNVKLQMNFIDLHAVLFETYMKHKKVGLQVDPTYQAIPVIDEYFNIDQGLEINITMVETWLKSFQKFTNIDIEHIYQFEKENSNIFIGNLENLYDSILNLNEMYQFLNNKNYFQFLFTEFQQKFKEKNELKIKNRRSIVHNFSNFTNHPLRKKASIFSELKTFTRHLLKFIIFKIKKFEYILLDLNYHDITNVTSNVVTNYNQILSENLLKLYSIYNTYYSYNHHENVLKDIFNAVTFLTTKGKTTEYAFFQSHIDTLTRLSYPEENELGKENEKIYDDKTRQQQQVLMTAERKSLDSLVQSMIHKGFNIIVSKDNELQREEDQVHNIIPGSLEKTQAPRVELGQHEKERLANNPQLWLAERIEQFDTWKNQHGINKLNTEYQEFLNRVQEIEKKLFLSINAFPNNINFYLNIENIIQSTSKIIEQLGEGLQTLFQVPLFIQNFNNKGHWLTIWEFLLQSNKNIKFTKNHISKIISDDDVERIRHVLNVLYTNGQTLKDVYALANDISKQQLSIKEIEFLYNNQWKNKLGAIDAKRSQIELVNHDILKQTANFHLQLLEGHLKFSKIANENFDKAVLNDYLEINFDFIQEINEQMADEWLSAFKKFEFIQDNKVSEVSETEKKYQNEAFNKFRGHQSALFEYDYANLETEKIRDQQKTFIVKLKELVKKKEIRNTLQTQVDQTKLGNNLIELQFYNLNLRKYIVFLKYYYDYIIDIDTKINRRSSNHKINKSKNVKLVYNKHVCEDSGGVKTNSGSNNSDKSTVEKQVFELRRDLVISQSWFSRTERCIENQDTKQKIEEILKNEEKTVNEIVGMLKIQGYTINDEMINENEIMFFELICKIRGIICTSNKN